MTARVLSTPTPTLWRQFGGAFHQDWPLGEQQYANVEGALKATLVDFFSDDERADLESLVSDLLENSEATGDLKRAWKLSGAHVYLPSKPRDWFQNVLAALVAIRHGEGACQKQ